MRRFWNTRYVVRWTVLVPRIFFFFLQKNNKKKYLKINSVSVLIILIIHPHFKNCLKPFLLKKTTKISNLLIQTERLTLYHQMFDKT
jgi:hypothetical protein